jgi:hypothetical protein
LFRSHTYKFAISTPITDIGANVCHPPRTRDREATTAEEWNACLGLVEAEAANVGLTCFDCSTWQDCDQSAGSNQCIGNHCEY